MAGLRAFSTTILGSEKADLPGYPSNLRSGNAQSRRRSFPLGPFMTHQERALRRTVPSLETTTLLPDTRKSEQFGGGPEEG